MVNLGKVLLLGDSYSTFEDLIPEGYATYYNKEYPEDRAWIDVTAPEQTWWYSLFQEYSQSLVLNSSWSGTTICHTGYGGLDCSQKSFAGRMDQLLENGFFEKNEIDTIVVFGGTNDSWADSPIGHMMYEDWTKEDLFQVLPAVGYLFHRIRTGVPKARVLCVINTELKPEISGGLLEACGHYGIEAIVLKEISKENGHPKVQGMKEIREQVIAYLEKKAKKEMIELAFQDWKAWIVPEYGMNTVRLTLNGEDVLRKAEDEEGYQKSCAHALPLLFPPNRVDEGLFVYEGEEYHLPITAPQTRNHCHGFLWKSPFRVTAQSEASVSATFENQDQIFPFPFRMDVEYRLDEDGFYQEFRVTNTGRKNMPVAFGLHTNFYERGAFSIPLGERYEANERSLPTGVMFALTDREKEYCAGTEMDRVLVDNFYTASGMVARIGDIEYAVSENFNHWTLYNGGGDKQFISMEPQCGAVNGLRTGIGILTLAPGETEVFHTRIRQVK